MVLLWQRKESSAYLRAKAKAHHRLWLSVGIEASLERRHLNSKIASSNSTELFTTYIVDAYCLSPISMSLE
jgi:hypothetical protein